MILGELPTRFPLPRPHVLPVVQATTVVTTESALVQRQRRWL